MEESKQEKHRWGKSVEADPMPECRPGACREAKASQRAYQQNSDFGQQEGDSGGGHGFFSFRARRIICSSSFRSSRESFAVSGSRKAAAAAFIDPLKKVATSRSIAERRASARGTQGS